MLIRLINPNTTASMTALIDACAQGAAFAGTTVEAVSPRMGPASIESHYDEALAVPGLLEEIDRGEREGVDGYVIACFGDPGLDAARELAGGPVIGIAEAAMHTATLLGRSFSVVTTLERTTGRARELVVRYGMGGHCFGVHACEIAVLDLDDPFVPARRRIAEMCRTALEQDNSEVIVLGCAGMADLCAELSVELGVPVVDGVAAATVMVQGLVAQRLRTSTRSEYARPPWKAYLGMLADFALG